jgi:hypothetical protein
MRILEGYLSILGASTKLSDGGGAFCFAAAYSQTDNVEKIQISSPQIRQQVSLTCRQLYEFSYS